MFVSALILFSVAIIPALFPVYSSKLEKERLKLLLVFAGAYLFSITVVHLLPELYIENSHFAFTGVFVLAGFFFQYIIDLFTSGVEHGHVHLHGKHSHSWSRTLSLLVALCIHAFLEGIIIAHPDGGAHSNHDSHTLLLGVALHKIPATIALVSFLTCDIANRRKCLFYTLLFALASPAGIVFGHLVQADQLLSTRGIHYLFAFVCGNFLHISTTIFFESSPEHKWHPKKLMVSLLATGIAVGIEFLL